MSSGKSGIQNIFLSVVAPAYNEESSIETVVRGWLNVLDDKKNEWEIIVTNDGSTDGTGKILSTLAQENNRIKIISLDINRGCGYALHKAIAQSRGQYVVTIDSDGQFDLSEYIPLLKKLNEGYDIVTGFRHRKIDNSARILLDRVFNLIVKIFFGISLKDTNCALKIFKREALEKIQIDSRGYSIPTEILIKAKALGYRIGEVRITHHQRPSGVSKLRVFKVSWQVSVFLLYLKLKLYLYKTGAINTL
ncbi:MAG: glycosyltransferase family 2 protein [Deltaproteobacteria bacterium]|jgi:glycosyltransferase involved in cell wall biosynthesis|nr:glycosyltransferase family 2 protein [Deltaproteobacteria bacterium]